MIQCLLGDHIKSQNDIIAEGRTLPSEQHSENSQVLIIYSSRVSPRAFYLVQHTGILHASMQLDDKNESINTLSLAEANSKGRRGSPIADRFMRGEFNLVVTIGMHATIQTVKELSGLGVSIAHLFVGIETEKYHALLKTGIIPEDYVLRGVEHQYEKSHDSFLLDIKASREECKKALITHDDHEVVNGHDFGQYGMRSRLEETLKLYGIEHGLIKVDDISSNLSRATEHKIHTSDVIFLTEQAGALAKTERLVFICNRTKKTLASCGLGAVRFGASIGFGIPEEHFAAELIIMMHEILYHGKSIHAVENRTLKVSTTQSWYNPDTFEKQNGKQPPKAKRMLNMIPINVEKKL